MAQRMYSTLIVLSLAVAPNGAAAFEPDKYALGGMQTVLASIAGKFAKCLDSPTEEVAAADMGYKFVAINYASGLDDAKLKEYKEFNAWMDKNVRAKTGQYYATGGTSPNNVFLNIEIWCSEGPYTEYATKWKTALDYVRGSSSTVPAAPYVDASGTVLPVVSSGLLAPNMPNGSCEDYFCTTGPAYIRSMPEVGDKADFTYSNECTGGAKPVVDFMTLSKCPKSFAFDGDCVGGKGRAQLLCGETGALEFTSCTSSCR